MSQQSQPAHPPIPLRRLSNFAYCPRLFYIQWVENLFADNADTIAGSSLHRRVDEPTKLSGDTSDPLPGKLRSLALESQKLGTIGVIDFVEGDKEGISIVEYKKGSAWRNENDERIPKDWDEVQVVAQALLLKEHGYKIKDAYIYYATDKRRVSVSLSPENEQKCLELIELAKKTAVARDWPAPLKDSKRCEFCSAFNICLPWESNFWEKRGNDLSAASIEKPKNERPPLADIDPREVLVVQKLGSSISRRGGEFRVCCKNETVRKIPSKQLRAIYVYGPVQISTQVLTRMALS